MGVKSLVKEGLLWCIGDGTSIRVWDDQWVLNGDSRYIFGDRVKGINFVCDLIDYGSMDWNVNLVTESFDERSPRNFSYPSQ